MAKIMVVDDDLDIQNFFGNYFGKLRGNEVKSASTGPEALDILENESFDIALVNNNLPGMSGIDLLEKFRQQKIDIGSIVISATTDVKDVLQAHRFGARDLVLKPINSRALLYIEKKIGILLVERSMRLSKTCKQCKYNKSLMSLLDEAHIETIYILAEAAEAKDEDTGNHVLRIQVIVREIALQLGFKDDFAGHMGLSSILHDVGKLKIPDNILKKPGKLTPGEWGIMKTHSVHGSMILRKHHFYEMARRVARHHHENWDGTGYPDGLRGNLIPLTARITAVADVWDALIHKRVYKKSWSEEDALTEMTRLSGRKFDPYILKYFLMLQRSGRVDEITKNLGYG